MLIAAALALALQTRDTLVYNLALQPARRTISVEGRITVSGAGRVSLNAPPAAGPARVELVGFAATDDRGRSLVATPSATGWTIHAEGASAVRFRYRLDFQSSVASSSTASGLDTLRLYAVTRSIFAAPDPLALRKVARPYPTVRVVVLPPDGWRVVTGWEGRNGIYTPASGDQLLGSTIAAAADYRFYGDTAGGSAWQLAIRGRRYFTDSALITLISESLRRSATTLAPVPVPRVTYTAELGRKGGVSGSLQGLDAIGLVWEPGENLEIARGHDTFHETLHLWFGGAMESERWWTEGVTDYYAARLYAEWTGRPQDLGYLIYQSHDNYRDIRHHATMTMAEENRRGMTGSNTDLLVYRKGMLAGLLLDAAIRRGSGGRRSLDDASRSLLELARARPGRRVQETEMRDAITRAGGREAGGVWDRVVTGREAITREELTRALRDVTGQTLAPPLASTKRNKVLRTPPP